MLMVSMKVAMEVDMVTVTEGDTVTGEDGDMEGEDIGNEI